MKSILLTTTALVAFAGAAVADGHTGVSLAATQRWVTMTPLAATTTVSIGTAP